MPSTSSSKKSTIKTTSAKKATSTAKKLTTTTKKTTQRPTKTSVKKPASTTKSITRTTTKKSTTLTPKKAETKSTMKKTETIKSELKTEVARDYYGMNFQFEDRCALYLANHRNIYGDPEPKRKKTRDGGVDIISKKRNEDGDIETVYYVSVKNKKGKIGTDVIDSLWGAMRKFVPKYDDGSGDMNHVAVVMISGEFSADAIALAKKSRNLKTILIDGHKFDEDRNGKRKR